MDGWSVPPVNRGRYMQTFAATDTTRSGFLTGAQSRSILMASGLPQPVLAQVWALSDIDVDGRLSAEEFIVAMHLIELAKTGALLPQQLPPDLVPPSFRRRGSQPSGVISPPEWAVPLPDRQRFGQLFAQYDTARQGFLTGLQAKNILMGTGVPPQMLAQVWNLSDVDTNGNLNVEEFILAMFFIDRVKAGQPLPASLPPELIPPFCRAKQVPIPALQQQPLPHQPLPQQSFPRPVVPDAPAAAAMAAVRPVAAQPPPVPQPPVVSQPPAVPPAPVAAPVPRSASVTSPIGTQPVAWSIPQPSIATYSAQFNATDRERSGFLTGAQARSILVASGLPQQTLAHVWNLSDINVDGRLTCEEFILAMHLIDMAKSGKPLPPALTPDLVPPSYRRGDSATGSRTGSVSDAADQLPPAGVMLTEWNIPQPSKLKYVQVFNTQDRSRSGFLTGVQARSILVQTGLSQDVLAKIWSLCDVTLSGKLTCEEFVLAMHLCDLAKSGDPVPAVLPPDLIPPSHKRKKSLSVSSAGSGAGAPVAVVAAAADVDPQSPGKITTFEDKRKENFDRGQAVLDRKRQALVDQQRREQEERERKEREEQAKREKVRLEMERKRQEELERQLQKQREIENEKEEARRKQLEQREAARREMERQRMAEWETQRISELNIQKQRVNEAIAALKSKKKTLLISVEKVNKDYAEGETALTTARDKVKEGKAVIDSMRIERDDLMKQMALSNAELKTLTEKENYLKREKEMILNQLRSEANIQPDQHPDGSDAAQIAMQNKQALILQLKTQIEEIEKGREQRKKDTESHQQQLDEIRVTLDSVKSRVRDMQVSYNQVVQKAKDAKEKILEKQQNFDPNADWGEVPSAATIVSDVISAATEKVQQQSGDKVKYHVLYPFEARNDDELNLNPGDIVSVIPNAAGEEGWLQGELNGAIGWFPAAYAEPLSDAAATTTTDNITVTEPAPVSEPASQPEITPVVSGEDRVIAIYPWIGKESNHLSFNKNDVIKVSERQDEWLQGELNGKTGWFPKSYVQDITSGSQAIPEEYYVTLYAFESQEPGDLGFEAGELVKVVKKEGEWWTGDISGRVGVFPSNYVREAETHEIPKPQSVQEPITPSPKAKGSLSRKESSPIDKRKPSLTSSKLTDSPKAKPKGKGKKPEVVIVVASYKATGPEQLSLEKGQLIQVKKKNTSGWWEGETQVKGKKKEVGWFPATYVKPLNAPSGGSDASSTRSTPDMGKAPVSSSDATERVISIYPFKAQHDDELSFEANEVINILSKDDPTWWKGQILSSGAIGLFPANHVQDYKSRDPSHEGRTWNGSHRNSTMSTSSSSSTLTTESKRQARINELISTEEDYVRDLEIVAVIFRDQLFSTKAITASDRDVIFSNWDQLIEGNQKFVKMLHKEKRQAMQTGMSIERIGSTITFALEMMEKAYIYYCNRLLTAEKLIEKKSDDNGYFADQVKRFSRDPRCSGLNLAAYLLIPFQRVTRYPLLIKKIVEYTGEDHPDHEDMKNALNVAETLCSRVNEGRRLYENRERLDWMQSHIMLSEEVDIRFNSEIKLTIHRELVHMGSLTKVNSGKELMAFLCNDILLLTTATRDIGKVSNLFASEKAMNTMYKLYKRPFFLDEVEIVNTSPCPPAEKSYQLQQSSSNSSSSSPSSLTDQDQSIFEIWIGRKSPSHGTNSRKLISFRAIHANDKLYWLQKLTKSIRSYHENIHRITRQDIRRTVAASHTHTARLLVTVSEAQNMKFRHSSLHYFFVASVGSPGDLQSDHPQIESSTPHHVTREHRASLAFDSLESTIGSVKFEQALRFLLSEDDIRSQSLIVSLYERTPFTPDLLLGMCQLSLAQVRQSLKKTTGRPLVFNLPLSSHHRNTIGGSSGNNHESATSTKIVVRVDLM